MKNQSLHKPKKKYYYTYKVSKFFILPIINYFKLLWKEKYETPRIELIPHFEIIWLWWSFNISIGTEPEWEWWIWLHKFNSGNLREALSNWPWKSFK